MKIYRILLLSMLVITSGLISCEKYLDVELGNQMNLDEVFSKRESSEAYLAQIYSYLPDEQDMIYGEGAMVPLSDEALFSWPYIASVNISNGSWGPTTGDFHIWTHAYKGIQQATIFMNNIEKNPSISQENRVIMKAEARFLRAYFYFCLLRRYGPVYIWGDKEADNLVQSQDIDRHPLSTNVDFITSEYDKCIELLPRTITDKSWLGRVTKGAVMAAKAELLLYMARPLYNGTELYKGLKNKDGDFLFPQTEDLNKWELAAQAAKSLIDQGNYSLYENTTEINPFRKAIKSYMGIYFEEWNNEIIWGRWYSNANSYVMRAAPPRVVRGAMGGFAPSLKLVDAYPMANSGRFPVTGYTSNGEPIIDPGSGYSESGFTDNYTHPLDDFGTIRVNNSLIGRDARFYASILANGMYWINTFAGQKLVTFFNGGTSSYQTTGDVVKSGYLWRRMSDPTDDVEQDNFGHFCWPYYRLGEIYLDYAEACNEKPNRNEAESLNYINLIRKRAGLNKIEEAYPEVVGNKILLRQLIRKERMVELAFENHRYHDLRTWMIAEAEMNGPYYTRDLTQTTYDASWSRTTNIFPGQRVFEPKHYFFPIHQNQLNEMKNITQNYGW